MKITLKANICSKAETVIARLTSKFINVKDDTRGTIGVLSSQKGSKDWIVIEKKG